MEEEIKYLEPPLIREILEQQWIILEINKSLIKILSRPSIVVKTEPGEIGMGRR